MQSEMSSEPDSKKSVSSVGRHKPRSRSTPRHVNNDKPRKKRHLSAANSLVSIPNTIKLSMLNSGLLPSTGARMNDQNQFDEKKFLIIAISNNPSFHTRGYKIKFWDALGIVINRPADYCKRLWADLNKDYERESKIPASTWQYLDLMKELYKKQKQEAAGHEAAEAMANLDIKKSNKK